MSRMIKQWARLTTPTTPSPKLLRLKGEPLGETRRERFNALTRYLVQLNHDGVLDKQGLGELLRLATARYAEAEIADRVETQLDRALRRTFERTVIS